MERVVYGWWVIRALDGSSEDRIASHHPHGSSSWDRADEGLSRKVDFDRFTIEWEDA